MRKLIFVLLYLISHCAAAQSSDATLTTQNNTDIRQSIYNNKKAADMIKALIDSKGSLIGSNTWTAQNNFTAQVNLQSPLTTTTATSSFAAIRIGGYAGDPSSLSNGDIWLNTSSNYLNIRIAGITSGLLHGAVTSGYLAYGIGNNQLGTSSNLTYVSGKFTSAPTGSVAGFNVGSLAGNPSSLSNGDLWYNSSANELNARINGATVSLGSGSGGLTIGTSSITSGTTTKVLYNNSGILGEYTVSGSGNVAMTASPTFTGNPIAPTQSAGDNSTKIATTAYVESLVTNTGAEIGTFFSEAWSSLGSWSNVGTPSASVSGGQMTLAGTSSFTTNYIVNSGYGKFNQEFVEFTWTETVGTVDANSRGVAFGLQKQSAISLGSSIMVNVELTSTATGTIRWYESNSVTAVQSQSVALVPVAGDVLYCKLTVYPNKYVMQYSIGSTGKVAEGVYYLWPSIGYSATGVEYSSSYMAFINIGQSASTKHTIGSFAAKSKQRKNVDYLIIGNSIAGGYSNNYMFNRAPSVIQKNYGANVELLARGGNSINDFTTAEVALFNARKIIIMCAGTNDVTINGAATAWTDYQAFVTALGSLITVNAPSGYSIANGNLIFTTELPRPAVTSGINTFNANIISTYGIANVISTHGMLDDGAGNFKTGTTFDNVHPNDLGNSMLADGIARFLNLKISLQNQNTQLFLYQDPRQKVSFLGNDNFALSNSDFRMIGHNIFINPASTPAWQSATSGIGTVMYGQASTLGYAIYTNTIGANSVVSPSGRMVIDYSGNTVFGTTQSGVYRTTNAGSNITSNFMIDPANSLTSGNAWSYSTTEGFVATVANGTRRIAGIGIKPVNITTTAGSEVADLGLYSKASGGALSLVTTISATNGLSNAGNLTLTTLGNKILIKEGSGGFMGQAALTSGTNAITVSGVTTSTRCFTNLVTPSGTTNTTSYQCVCTSNTVTLRANIAAGTINTADASTLNYILFEPAP